MADNTFSLDILTPERQFFSGQVEALTFTADDGEWTILKGHAPMIVVLRPGSLQFKIDGEWKEAVNSEGYMEVSHKGVVLFAQTCDWPEEIDRMEEERARKRAEEAMRQSHSQAQFRANQIMLARAMARLRNSRNNVNLD